MIFQVVLFVAAAIAGGIATITGFGIGSVLIAATRSVPVFADLDRKLSEIARIPLLTTMSTT